jgi:putative protein-disulfide isomerase
MIEAKLHYIHDPLCGWCYAVKPLTDAITVSGMQIVLHGGGLWDPVGTLGDDKRAYIRRNDRRIAKLTGMTFGTAYLDELLARESTIFWSRPTIAGVLAAAAVKRSSELAMMHAIQHAHYFEGRSVVEPVVLSAIAGSIGLPTNDFDRVLPGVSVDDHIFATRDLMRRNGLGSFPSFLVEAGNMLTRIDHQNYYGRPDAFVDAVQMHAMGAAAVGATGPQTNPSLTYVKELP